MTTPPVHPASCCRAVLEQELGIDQLQNRFRLRSATVDVEFDKRILNGPRGEEETDYVEGCRIS